MKNIMSLVLAVTVLALSGVCLYQARQLQTRRVEITDLQHQVRTQAKQSETIKTSQERLNKQRLDMAIMQHRATVASSNAAAVTASAEKTTDDAKGLGGFGSAMAKMFDNPDMKKIIAQQQRAMMDTMYGPLFKELGLSKEDTDRFKELLLAQQMKGVEQAGTLFGGKSDGKSKAELVAATGNIVKQSQDEIKVFLGDERYNQYKDYTETLGDRLQLNQLAQQLANSQNPITSDQQGRLISIMKEERQSLAADFANLGWSGGKSTDPSAVLSEEKMNQIMDLQQNLGQRVFERAQSVLQPEQLDAFGAFQTNQLAMQRLGIKMVQGMMGENKPPATGTTPPIP